MQPLVPGTAGSSWVDISQLLPFAFPSLHRCHRKSQSCSAVKQKEMLAAFLFPGQLYPLLSTKCSTGPGTAPACNGVNWAEDVSWEIQEQGSTN